MYTITEVTIAYSNTYSPILTSLIKILIQNRLKKLYCLIYAITNIEITDLNNLTHNEFIRSVYFN
jgi:hypothetical protein